MTTLPALAVTGSTGALGGLVAHDLAERGVPQRLLARSPERAPRLPGAVAPARDGCRRSPGPTSPASRVSVLLDAESHRAATYDLTGPESITLAEAAAVIGETTARHRPPLRTGTAPPRTAR